MTTMPENLRQKLYDRGYKRLEVGNIKLHLSDNKITRVISIDGRPVAEPVFETDQIDWEIVEQALP